MNYNSIYEVVKAIIAALGGDDTIEFESTYAQAKYIAEDILGAEARDWESTYDILLYIEENYEPGPAVVKYTASFNIEDAEGTAPASVRAEAGETITLPGSDTFEKEGYSFDGWTDGNDLYQAGDAYEMPESNVEFSAVFQEIVSYSGFRFTALEDGSAVAMMNENGNTPALQYSTDFVNWNDWDYSEIDFDEGESIAFRGNEGAIGRSNTIRSRFVLTGKVKASGNIESLISYDYESGNVEQRDYTYPALFRGNAALVDIEELIIPTTELKTWSFGTTFQESGISKLPVMHFDTYSGSITSTSPYAAPLTQCFYKCTNLTDVSGLEMKVDRLVDSFMPRCFAYCSNILKAPKIYSTSGVSYSINGLYSNCTRLNHIFAMFVTIPTQTEPWVGGVQTTSGIFVKNINATWTKTGTSGVPNNWTVIYYDMAEEKYYTSQDKAQECDEYGNVI